ncbi:hypothetical protein [Frigoriglobus tundricola]|uniref:Uncharacterized protein n=1 Tax=Frigoriglobus tundricola TaxID=2774151 RepID=A0A6M5Z1R0_9BACT|nr:hypothetical protein [Frigoriglobus tundricola]QJX00006.1 hypothetical protein FTUN_7628 [Frigoriglobus tundricola]
MTRRKRDLAETIRAALEARKPGHRLAKALEKWAGAELTRADAEGLVAVMAEQTAVGPLVVGDDECALRYLAELFQADSTDDATRVLRDGGMKELTRLFDAAAELPDCPTPPLAVVCQMFALYAYAPGVQRVAETVRRHPDEAIWETVFGLYGEENHPHGPALVEQLRDPLPDGFAAVVLLDLANTLGRQKRLERHPFDTADGYQRIEAWLTDPDEEHFHSAHSAAAALPFLAAKNRTALAALAMDHPAVRVQMEAAWASAYLGGTAGLKFLARLCEDPRHSLTARRYLDDLGQSDRVPAPVREPDFEAMAQMCQWLAHPSEHGRPPEEIELYDTRELDWPPTNDRRRLWLFKFAYLDSNGNDTGRTGLGLVGSITFSLGGETTADMSPEDAYGVHCCWELEVNDDPRAPKTRSAKAGRKLLGI